MFETRSDPHSGRGSLFTGGLAAILASACCLGPLILVGLGVSGAWIGNLKALEPFRPIFVSAALLFMFFAYRDIFRADPDCKPGEACALPSVQRTYRILFWIVALLVVVALLFPYVLPLLY